MLAYQAFPLQRQTHLDKDNLLEGDAPVCMTLATKGTACLPGLPLKRQTHLDKGNLVESDAPVCMTLATGIRNSTQKTDSP